MTPREVARLAVCSFAAVALVLSAGGASAHTARVVTQISLAEYRPGEITGDVRSKAGGCVRGRGVVVQEVESGATWGETTTAADGTFAVQGQHEPNQVLRIVVRPKTLRQTPRHLHVCRKGFAALTTSP